MSTELRAASFLLPNLYRSNVIKLSITISFTTLSNTWFSSVLLLEANVQSVYSDPKQVPYLLWTQALQKIPTSSNLHPDLLSKLQRASKPSEKQKFRWKRINTNCWTQVRFKNEMCYIYKYFLQENLQPETTASSSQKNPTIHAANSLKVSSWSISLLFFWRRENRQSFSKFLKKLSLLKLLTICLLNICYAF